MDDPMGEKSSISCRVRATFRLSESTNLIRFLVCVLFPVVVFCTWTLLCWLGCTWSLPGQEFQHQRWWMCSGTCVWGYCLVILSKEVFFHIISIWLEICSLMIVHLKLQYDSEEYVDVVRMGVHNYVEDAFLLDLPEVKDSWYVSRKHVVILMWTVFKTWGLFDNCQDLFVGYRSRGSWRAEIWQLLCLLHLQCNGCETVNMIDHLVLQRSAWYDKDMNLTSSCSLMSPYSSSYKMAARVQFRNNIMSWNFKWRVLRTEPSCSHCLILKYFATKSGNFSQSFGIMKDGKFFLFCLN